MQAQYEAVVQKALPSVVQINAPDSTGSGVVYDDKGDIVTNEHVIGSNKTVEILATGEHKMMKATVVGEFAPDDLAVVRVSADAESLKPAAWANSDNAQIGEIVLAMGNPLGLTDTVTQGIISATGRTVGSNEPGGGKALITAAIQTSAAINPGNSGGALVDLQDEVVGIPTLAAQLPNQGGVAPGIGFAIPSNTVKKIASQLIDKGKVTDSGRASLDVTAETAANPQGQGVGIAVLQVTSGGAADKAGIRAGDVIVGVNDTKTLTLQQLEGALNHFEPGNEATVHFVRSGTNMSAKVTFGSLGS
jgi:S1-C subfamily serine protease